MEAKKWHKKQWEYLMGAIKQGKMSHAFIFSGPEGLGKRKIAFELLEKLNSNQTLKEPDLIEIKPEKGLIALDRIQQLQKSLAFKPFQADFKAVLIDSAQLMNQEAQNCLLKTLENPPAKTIFLLLTNQKGLLLKTILSRCQELKFFPLPKKEMRILFKEYEKEKDFEQILSSGLPEKALAFFEDRTLFQEQLKKEEFIKKVLKGSLVFRFNLAKKIFKDNKENSFDFASFLEEILVFLRSSLLDNSEALKRTLELQFLSKSYTINKRLAFEVLMLQLPRR